MLGDRRDGNYRNEIEYSTQERQDSDFEYETCQYQNQFKPRVSIIQTKNSHTAKYSLTVSTRVRIRTPMNTTVPWSQIPLT